MENNKQKNCDYIVEIRKERTPGELVAARRKQLGWSQEELEWRSGVSRVQISRIERDLVRPTYETIEKLEKVLQIPIREKVLNHKKIQEKQKIRTTQGVIRNFVKRAVEKKLPEAKLEELLDQTLSKMDFGDTEKTDLDELHPNGKDHTKEDGN